MGDARDAGAVILVGEGAIMFLPPDTRSVEVDGFKGGATGSEPTVEGSATVACGSLEAIADRSWATNSSSSSREWRRVSSSSAMVARALGARLKEKSRKLTKLIQPIQKRKKKA